MVLTEGDCGSCACEKQLHRRPKPPLPPPPQRTEFQQTRLRSATLHRLRTATAAAEAPVAAAAKRARSLPISVQISRGGLPAFPVIQRGLPRGVTQSSVTAEALFWAPPSLHPLPPSHPCASARPAAARLLSPPPPPTSYSTWRPRSGSALHANQRAAVRILGKTSPLRRDEEPGEVKRPRFSFVLESRAQS